MKLAACLFTLAVIALPQEIQKSPPPTPTPGKAGKVEQSEATPKEQEPPTDQRATAPPKTTVHQSSSEVAAQNQQQAGTKNGEKSSPADLVGTNGFIAVFTGILVFAGYLQYRAMRQQAEHMREGLRLTRDTMVAANPPRLIVRNVTTALSGDDGLTCTFYVENVGTTPATITHMYVGAGIGPDGVLPGERPYEGRPAQFQQMQAPLPPGVSYKFLKVNPDKLEFPGPGGAMGYWYILGWINYLDDSRNQRTAIFCRKEDLLSRRFLPVDDPDYENATNQQQYTGAPKPKRSMGRFD